MHRAMPTMFALSLLLFAASVPAVAQSGSGRAWGHNGYGQLGDNTVTIRTTPVQVSGLADAAAIAAGTGHSLALMSDQTVRAWGRNDAGQLGDGTNTQRRIPVQVSGLAAVRSVCGGHVHSLAAKTDGTVWAWGSNTYGQLGDGTGVNQITPVQVATLTTVKVVAAGNYHSLALMENGTVWAWGRNDDGQLGDGTNTSRNAPVQVSGLSAVKAIGAGASHSMAICEDGSVWAWGYNGYGQLGDGTFTGRTTPVQVTGASGARMVAGGNNHSVACMSDGTAKTWGRNNYGQLGDGTATTRNSPVSVTGITTAERAAASGDHCVVGLTDGTVRAWGRNTNGQLGDGTTSGASTPVQVVGSGGSGVLSHVRGIGCGSEHTVALWLNEAPSADEQWVSVALGVPKDIALSGSDGDGDALTFEIVTPPAHGTLDGTPPDVTYTTGETYEGADGFGFRVYDGYTYSPEVMVHIATEKQATSLLTIDRTGTITETVTLRQYDLKRTTDNALLQGKSIAYKVDGTDVGTAVTDAGGDSILNWTIAEGPATRTITAEFGGDAAYHPSSDDATLTCQSWVTKMVPFARTGRITDRTDLKARLLRSDNAPLYGKGISFSIDGTFIIARNTNVDGYAIYPYYDIPDGAGAGVRTILSEWPGNGGYASISKTANLTVLKAIPYIWVLSKSVTRGNIANLYAYFRRLYDYKKQEGKTVSFKIDGTWIADAVTGSGAFEPGVARYLYGTGGLSLGAHTIRCEFAGDAWLDAGYGEGTLTLY